MSQQDNHTQLPQTSNVVLRMMPTSYKEQILSLRHIAETQASALTQYKKELEECKTSTYSLYRGMYLLQGQFELWDQLDQGGEVESIEMPAPAEVNKLNSTHQADICITLISALIRSLGRTNNELTEIGQTTSGMSLDINDVWKSEPTTIPSPLTRSLALIEKTLAEVNDKSRKVRDSISEDSIREADLLIKKMEEDLRASQTSPDNTKPTTSTKNLLTPPSTPGKKLLPKVALSKEAKSVGKQKTTLSHNRK